MSNEIPELAKTSPTGEIQLRVDERIIFVTSTQEVVTALRQWINALVNEEGWKHLTPAQQADLRRLIDLGESAVEMRDTLVQWDKANAKT